MTQRQLSWTDAGFLVFGGFTIVFFSAGAALAQIGPWSLVIWFMVSLVGLMQARLVYKLAKFLPDKAGGTATYAHEAFKRFPFLAFVSSWSYWLAWTPAVALNCFLASSLIKSLVPVIAIDARFLAIIFVFILYGLNYFGLAKAVVSSRVLAILILLPLLALVFLGFKQAADGEVWQKLLHFGPIRFIEWWKWFFVIAWTGYAVEIVASMVSELKDPHGHTGKIFKLASGLSLLAFILLPFALALVGDWQVLSQDVFAGLLPLFAATFGQLGSIFLAVLLLAALVYSSLSFIIPSTRTVYQMSKDGLLPKSFSLVNKFGVPKGSLVLDLSLNILLLLFFGGRLIEMLAAVNVGYIITFVILPVAFLKLSSISANFADGLDKVLAVSLLIVNVLALLVGGLAWGVKIFSLGLILVLAGYPLYRYARSAYNKALSLNKLAAEEQ